MSFPASPITPELLVAGAVGISEVVADGTDVYWAENRPSEAGRAAIMRWREGEIVEVTEPDVNVRTRVHEYGGGAWWVAGGRVVYSDDNRGGELYLLDVDSGSRRRLTSEGHRYADGRLTADGEWFVCVRERHDETDSDYPVRNEIVAVPTAGGAVRWLAADHDFYSSPRIAADGRLVCVAWDHPDMPWDFTELVALDLTGDAGAIIGPITAGDESIVLPDFTADGRLLAVTDRSNWWNLVEVDFTTGAQTPVVTGAFEIATPPWVFGSSRWVDTPEGVVVVAATPGGDEIRFANGGVETRHTSVSAIRSLGDGRVAYAASSFSEEPAVWIHDGDRAHRISEPRDLGLGPEWFPEPELITFDVSAVDPSQPAGTVAHALFYAAEVPVPSGAADDADDPPLAPLLVLVHGGPTAAARRQLNLTIRFWTTRGVAVADVDYRGSTLYGREFRDALKGGWGVTDVVDCVAAARHLADAGRVDSDRMVIAGGSAGGLTVLNALAHHDVFSGGICRYGVTDLAALATDTHKFEERYLDALVGPWPDAVDVYTERSPMTHVDRIDKPMLVLQGLEDKVVPPSQSELIVESLRERGVPVTYLAFDGEGHGFRKAETIVAALTAEEEFFESL